MENPTRIPKVPFSYVEKAVSLKTEISMQTGTRFASHNVIGNVKYGNIILLKGFLMANNPPHHCEPWTKQQVRRLEKLADQNTPTRVMGLKLGRTEDAVRTKASEENISLKPTNQSPYNRRKK
jgi:hypothetical protein